MTAFLSRENDETGPWRPGGSRVFTADAPDRQGRTRRPIVSRAARRSQAPPRAVPIGTATGGRSWRRLRRHRYLSNYDYPSISIRYRRSEERRGGKECVSTGRTRGSTEPYKKKKH